MQSRTRFILIGIATVLLVGIGGGTLALSQGSRVADGASPPQPIAIVQQRDFTPRVLATGSIRLLPGARIEVGARVSGVVVSLPVTQGSRVARDDVIARLDDREARMRLTLAEASVTELEAFVRQQTEDLGRTEALARAQGVTQQELLAARTTSATARARLEGARANRALAELQLGYTVIRAPIAGIVGSVTTHEGETITASLASPTFVSLLDPTRIECVALVDESDIGRVALGNEVEFKVDAYPGRTFRGVVVGVAPDATVISGVVDYEVRVRIADQTSELKPQMTASISISGVARRALVVATSAVRQSALGTYVWRRKGGAPARVTVALGARQPDVSEVRSGLASGDTVLTGGFPEDGPRR